MKRSHANILTGLLCAFAFGMTGLFFAHAQNGVGSQVQPVIPYNVAEGPQQPGGVPLKTAVPLSSQNAVSLRANLGGSLLALSGSNPAGAGAIILSSSAQPMYTLTAAGYVANGWAPNQVVLLGGTSMKIYTTGTSCTYIRMTSTSAIITSGTFP